MGLLQPIEHVAGYLKAGFLGFNKSGKTYTATELAIGTRKLFGLTGPIAFFDTETGSDYIAPKIEEETGMKALRVKSRTFDDLMAVGRECLEQNVSVWIIDSITHPWRELMDAYMKRLNEARQASNLSKKNRMDIQDIMKIKELWQPWPDWYLNAPLHIIICGRAGFSWDMVEDEDGKKKLEKTGVKMKVESEFGFEPSLLVEMERVQNNGSRVNPGLQHQATVLGDRFGVIDAHVSLNPTFEFFLPHVEMLLGGKHSTTKTEVESRPDVDTDGNPKWRREKQDREILCEEIQGEMVRVYPSQQATDKKAKADLLDKVFNTRSWKKVENMRSENLRDGLERLRELLKQETVKQETVKEEATT